jgi:hypothetical protein
MIENYYELQDEHGANVGECYDRTLGQAIERAIFTGCAIAGLGPLYCKRVTARESVWTRTNDNGATTRTRSRRTEELELCMIVDGVLTLLADVALTAGEERMLEAIDAPALARGFRVRLDRAAGMPAPRRYTPENKPMGGLLQAA